ncbi:MAG: tripartite tricarboxylate transporter substrate binding protein [Burkholderiaceae bacterium]|nr:tripartite tricarboxylate transporter substrate binding protein [Burkholderiaceae bacterium]
MLHKFLNAVNRCLIVGPALVLACLGAQSFAQAPFPNKPIRLIVPFSPGGVTDTSGRLIADQLSKRLGQQIIVENKPGASGNIGSALVATAEPDGYTLVLGFDGTMVINPHIFQSIPFDTIKDFAPIGKIGDTILVLVAYPKFEAQTLQEIIALSKQPGKTVTFGSSGVGSPQHVGIELLNQRTGAKLMHIPYKGGGQAMIDVQGGNIPLVYTAIAGAYAHIKNGRLNAVAVSSKDRAPSLPDVPTFIESGIPDFVVSGWVGVFAPAKTPRPVVEFLNRELNAVLATPEVKAKLDTLGIEATPGTPEQFAKEIKADFDRYGVVIKAAGIKAD